MESCLGREWSWAEVRFFEFPLWAWKFFFQEAVEEASDIYHKHEGTLNLGGQHLSEKKRQTRHFRSQFPHRCMTGFLGGGGGGGALFLFR